MRGSTAQLAALHVPNRQSGGQHGGIVIKHVNRHHLEEITLSALRGPDLQRWSAEAVQPRDCRVDALIGGGQGDPDVPAAAGAVKLARGNQDALPR